MIKLLVILTVLLEVTNSKPLEMKKRSVFDVIPGFDMKHTRDRQIGQ